MRRKVLYVSATSQIAGAERSLMELVCALDRRRVQPVVAMPEAGPLRLLIESAGAEVFPIPSVRPRRTGSPVRLAAMGSRLAAAVAVLAREARRSCAELIHSNSTYAHLIGGPAAACAGLPCVWHVRDLHQLPVLKRFLAPLTRRAVFVSRAVERAVRLPLRPHLRASVIPNAIDADAFARSAEQGVLRAELGLPPGAPLLLMAAQMIPWKGHSTLIRAAALLRRKWPSLTVAIAGEDLFGDHRQYGHELRRLVAELGLRVTVHFLGYRRDVAALMADCNAVVIPSKAEPFGRVALEAMAVGRPVVGTRAGGLTEVVADGETGILVPPSAPEALAGAVGKLLSDPKLARAMGEAGARRVREHFDIAGHTRAITRLYDQVLAPRGRPGGFPCQEGRRGL